MSPKDERPPSWAQMGARTRSQLWLEKALSVRVTVAGASVFSARATDSLSAQ